MNTHKKILIADDDDGIAKLYTIYLETKNITLNELKMVQKPLN